MELRKDVLSIAVGVLVVIVGIALYAGGVFKKNAPAEQNATDAGGVPVVTFSNTAVDASKQVTPPDNTYKDPSGKGLPVLAYELHADKGVFLPQELVIAKGSRVQVNFRAIDADYDLQIAPPIGAYIVAKAGTTSVFGFDATNAGRYELACMKMCPKGVQMRGAIIVK